MKLPLQGEPSLGPLVARGGRLWVFAATGNAAGREIVEFRPSAEKTEKEVIRRNAAGLAQLRQTCLTPGEPAAHNREIGNVRIEKEAA